MSKKKANRPFSHLNIGNGVKHATYGPGVITSVLSGDRGIKGYMIRFGKEEVLKSCDLAEVESFPAAGKMQRFNRGKRQFSKTGYH